MRLSRLNEGVILNHAQLDRIISAVKGSMGERGFVKAVYYQMHRFGYGDEKDIFNQISVEMRRRSALRRGARKSGYDDNNYMIPRAIQYAKDRYRDLLLASPSIDDVDLGDVISNAADKFGVSYDSVARGFSAL